MADVEAFVWHDAQGNIIAVGHPIDSGKKIEPLVYGDRHVVKLSVAYEDLPTLHLTHKVNRAKASLIPREVPREL